MPELTLTQTMYWIGQAAVASLVLAAVVEARRKRYNLLGLVVHAICAALVLAAAFFLNWSA